jgi:Zn-dependent peptidase ImmA (M78 family)/DNA-binding XRE family transcriptional regulator
MTARTEALANSKLLVWARETAGFTLEDAAERLKTGPERLVSWERGQSRPSIAQLRKLAQIYKRPLAVFYLPEVPSSDEPIHDFRRLQGKPDHRNVPELLLAIRWCRERRDIALDLYKELDGKPPRFEMGRASDDPEETAAHIRKRLNISLDEQSSWRTSYEAFHRWRAALEDAGVLVFQVTNLEVAEVRGFSIAERPLPVVAVNIKDSVYGRIFTMIHELAHILVNTGGICDVDEETEAQYESLEVFCNHVAGSVIVPRDELLSSPLVAGVREPRQWPDDVLKQLSRNFHASRETILRRLLILNLTTSAHYREKRRKFAIEYAEREAAQPGFAPHHRVQLSSAGPLFTQLVLEAFNRERITASDVSDFLSIRVKHLAEIERDLLQQAI